MRTGIKLLIMLFIFLAAGYIEVRAESVPVLKDQKKISYNRLEGTLSVITGLALSSTRESTITWED